MKKHLICMIFGAILFSGCGDDGIGAKPKAPSCGDTDVKETVKKIIFSNGICNGGGRYCACAALEKKLSVEEVMQFYVCKDINKEKLLKDIEELKQAKLTEIDTIEQQDRESRCEAKFLDLSLNYSARYTDDGKTLKVKITQYQ
ncbi:MULTISPECIES: hypothetical protein [unclassified Campylobacter]|uniref:hypothetical protein n=1 Tax=unclassified Campylobacter TaxID=2593542 RepID=UPI0022E9DA7E|nr:MULTISPECIES: hypothetical protein [unclassified Campylobacter]MDA3043493.1 hypothetical protein [Campylobacter sp. JMF_09 ED2]MDA3045247.1 hypothetical protein [Campylobacter sp. JMF_07 ED4]MDA3064153.1 hypothetical protein [Campylobacter sp. JMF_11 EL3]MDA3071975.1 hypothetical protein [Campylobacter sp. VBCF_03 NA9]MDA3075341.1 hypothetical protein [Campylobacter sp. JMF_05 ED3]